MQFSIASVTLLSLSASVSAIPVDQRFEVDPTYVIPRAVVTCAEYSETANYSAIGLNSTYRGAFLVGSPDGTDYTRSILDKAQKKMTDLKLRFDEALNAECGNLSTVADTEVTTNFTNGIVGPFAIKKSAGDRLSSGMGTVILAATFAGAALLL
ncbi:hypothetical protein HYALB_00013881 [Hymenoscyphus albidus]|uniref:Uncharacterized protein n=1 Tax=Hymenoscyphus albidus TaxID=595503 RepID=A0A9N9QBM3_9HELO|nr:hypothetical protein HYALB_00013881 [Hymenoscyphus albidus]